MSKREMVMLRKKVECFNCHEIVKAKTAYIIKLNTLEGAHEVKMCEPCAMQFDELMKEIEEIKNDPAI
jgi:hypothetical protein